MPSTEIIPIFLALEAGVLLVFVAIAFSRKGRSAGWLAPALALLAGIGMAAFLLYAFAAVFLTPAGSLKFWR